MDFLSASLQFLPQAATHPYALIAYLVVILAWVGIQFRVARSKALLSNIEKLNPEDRLIALEAEMGTAAVRGGLSPEEWLKQKRQAYYFLGFLAALAALVVVFTIAVKESQTARSVAELSNILTDRSTRFFKTIDRAIASVETHLRTADVSGAASLRKIHDGLATIREDARVLILRRSEAMERGDLVRFYELGNDINSLSAAFEPLIGESEKYAGSIERVLDSLPPGVTSAKQAEALLVERQQRKDLELMAKSVNSMMPPPSSIAEETVEGGN